MGIGKSFGAIAQEYDSQRRKFLPCFDDLYHVPVRMMDLRAVRPSILDVGAGTGIFAEAVVEKYPDANVTLIDLSTEMLDVAKQRFEGNESVKYLTGDYIEYDFKEKYDAVISALSIHHLTAHQKERLYHKFYGLLKEGGVFINIDYVLAPDEATETRYTEIREDDVAKSGLSDEEIRMGRERWKYDDPSPLDDQLRWLRAAGFAQVDCVYKYFQLAVMYAIK